jgi:cytochrome oxidase assembly protein ShyY1
MSRSRLPWYALALAGMLVFAALGFWQLSRAHQKEHALAAFAAAELAQPRDLSELLRRADAASPELPQRVAADGRYDDGVTLLLDNQVLDGKAGVDVLTLFRPDAGGKAVLVDRGWLSLPPERTPPHVPSAGNARVRIEGTLRAPPSQGVRMGEAEFARGRAPPLLAYLDLDSLERETGAGLVRAVLQLAPDAEHGFTRRWQALPGTMPPERHRAYAVQWFALALLVPITTLVLRWRR